MKDEEYDVCIVGGLGHVGLPLGISFAQSGKRVVLIDINQEAINTVRKGRMPFMEQGAEEALREVLDQRLFISSNENMIYRSHFVVIVIGTPVDEHLNPEFSMFKEFFLGLQDFISDDQHIILRSTVFPGTTEKVKELLRSKGKRTRVSFCPERIAEGKAMEELRSLPQIVASFDEDSFNEAEELFLSLVDEVIPLDLMEAELVKLLPKNL